MNRSILVIDDEPDNFDVIETLLSQQNYELHYAASGQEAIDSLDIYQPDLILLDVMMPGIDGISVCRQIKAVAKWQAIPIIMVTALDSKSDLARCLNAGADDFISKPINALELRARVHSMLRIKQQYDDLQSLLKLREDMVQMLIHDLRNPLTGILLNLELLRSPDYPKEKHPYKIDQIHNYASVLERLIDDLLQIALIESDRLYLNLTEVEIGDLIQSAVGKFESIAAQRNLAIVVQLPESPQRKISVDASLFQRVIDNLLSNAIKFSPRKSQIIINVEFLNSGHVKIQTIDSGPGVPVELQKTIFQKYEIGTMMPDVSQIGLGLAFCKMVVEAHQGEIQVMNNQPKGSVFEITLTV
jgi:two-component system, sensor histidine kinase and response regulator